MALRITFIMTADRCPKKASSSVTKWESLEDVGDSRWNPSCCDGLVTLLPCFSPTYFFFSNGDLYILANTCRRENSRVVGTFLLMELVDCWWYWSWEGNSKKLLQSQGCWTAFEALKTYQKYSLIQNTMYSNKIRRFMITRLTPSMYSIFWHENISRLTFHVTVVATNVNSLIIKFIIYW